MGDSILDRFHRDAVVMFVGPHPDDETVVSPLLAFAVDRCREVFVVSLTRGEAGWNLHKEDLARTLAQVREAELRAAARVLGFTPVVLDYINGQSQAHPDGLAVLEREPEAFARWRSGGGPGESTEAVRRRWTSQAGDPLQRLVRLFREKKPTVVLTYDPDKGFTNHVEHKALAPVVLEAVREHNRSAATRAVLYYAYNPADTVPDAERIMTRSLCEAGAKDYRGIAWESRACYESQFGTRGSARRDEQAALWQDQQLVKLAE